MLIALDKHYAEKKIQIKFQRITMLGYMYWFKLIYICVCVCVCVLYQNSYINFASAFLSLFIFADVFLQETRKDELKIDVPLSVKFDKTWKITT